MPKSNISHKEQVALSELKSDDSIIILGADKGRSTVVMNKEQYIEKINNLIMDDKTYRPLNRDPTTSFENKIGKAIKQLTERNKLNKNSSYATHTQELVVAQNLWPTGSVQRRYTTQTHCELHQLSFLQLSQSSCRHSDSHIRQGGVIH
ncbi:hypothetical protein HOLleu_34877 [Holothuria leucospilota]|uniref:Uncharacterized protein n=1 Tax=Holothuria leucospilota TaxID=206669 RepID=A0A9Q0YLW1_HOLLE|nr:hypothetical protein HOLleu_34877 [Holothuria leucospilota]